MAKRKHNAALFEVIHTAPPPPLNIGKQKRSWWFGARNTSSAGLRSLHASLIPDEPHRPASTPSASATACSPEAQLRARFAETESAHEVAVFSADEPEGLEMEDESAYARRTAEAAAIAEPLDPSPAVKEFCAGGFRIDPNRQELTFKINYTTAALVAFIGLVLLGLAFVVGKRIADHGNDDAAIVALRTGNTNPSVLDINHADRSTDPSAGVASRHSANEPIARSDTGQQPGTPQLASAGPAQRTIGLDYLVVQSYPDRKSAQDAADMLTQGGVPCTVEHGLRWAPNWYSVVTVAGYPPHSAEGERLAESIDKITAEQSKQGHHYRFKPQGYQWNQ